MLKRLPFFVLLCLCALSSFAQTPNHVVISQVYGGGGNSGAPFKNDFVELYNPTGITVSLAGWSLQYVGAASSNWDGLNNKVALSGSIAAGGYYLIQLGTQNSNEGSNLPTADLTFASLNIAAGAGKIALVNNITSLSGDCPTGLIIVDFVGYGSTATCKEGGDGNHAPGIGTATAAHRKNYGCVDSDNNKADFTELAPNPRNSASPGHLCQVNITVNSVAHQPFCINGNTGTTSTIGFTSNTSLAGPFHVYLSDANASFTNALLIGSGIANGTSGNMDITIPAGLLSGEGYRIRIDATSPQVYGQPSSPVEIINGAKNVANIMFSPEPTTLKVHWTNPSGCFEEIMIVGKENAFSSLVPAGDGSAYTGNLNFSGNGTPFDGGKVLYRGTQSGQTITNLTTGQSFYIKIFTRRGTDWSIGLEASAKPRRLPAAGEVVINQFNPGYSAANANYEFIELVNNTGNTIDLSELAIRYQSPTTGNPGVAGGNLTGTLLPHSYWLLTAYPASNPSEEITIGATTSLVRDGNISGGMGATSGQIALVRRTDEMVLDAVRYGTVNAGTYMEGTPLPAPSNNSGFKRMTDGEDLNNNSADFVAVSTTAIDLRNSQSRLAKESAEIPASNNLKRIYVTGNAELIGAVTLTEKLVLQSGKLTLNNFHFTTQKIEGGSATTYVQTNGTGELHMLVGGANPVLFPVGNSTFNPVSVQHGGDLKWSISVKDAVQAANAGGSVQRTWNITPSQIPNSGAAITFYYDEGDATQLGPVFDAADKIQVYHQHGGVWQKAGAPLDPAGTVGSIRTVTLSNWTQFSPFVLSGASQSPLPIKFTGLRLFGRGADLVLQFAVHNEMGVDHYKVETSADGHNWEVRALLMPQSNNGGTVQYEFADPRPLVANRYYRVQGMEQNGVVSFSGVALARAKVVNPGLQVAPNPVVGTQLQYTCGNLPTGSYMVRIYNSAGQPLHVARITHAGGWLSGNLELPNLQGGWYVLELAGPQTTRQTFLIR